MADSVRLLTTEELAERLQVQPDTVREWSRRGRVPVIRITPKVVRYDYAAVLSELTKLRQDEVPHV